MAIIRPTYMEVITSVTPRLDVTCEGDGSDYELLVCHNGTLPSKAVLDQMVVEATKERAWLAIKDKRDLLKVSGTKVGNYWFHADDASRIQQLGLVMFGANLPKGIMWKTMTGEFVLMTPELAMQIFIAQATHDTILFTIAEQKRQAMLASADPAQYDQNSGWPETYQGTAS
jgi:hypothetical protein